MTFCSVKLGRAQGILVLLFCAVAWAKTLVVPHDFSSIQAALNQAAEGDTVYATAGVYHENVTLADGVVLVGQDVDRTILRGDRRNPVVRAARNSVITGFTIENGATGILSENTNIVIDRNFIRQNSRSGIQCVVSLPQIRNNIVAGNNWTGIYCELIAFGTKTAIEHNCIADNGYCGIMLSNKSSVLVQNNLLFRNKEFGIFVSQDARKSRIIYNDINANRKPFNMFALVDATNIDKDPRLPSLSSSKFSQIAGYDSPLRGLGKEGTQIGVLSESMQKSSSVDTDKDGIADDKDLCPDVPEDMDGYEDADGCPDYDNDNDGIYDQFDQCPDEPEDYDGFEDKDGCPDYDNDRDGIPDVKDKCPNTPEVYNGYQDDDGCPDQRPPQ
jgi:hypothetical protein